MSSGGTIMGVVIGFCIIALYCYFAYRVARYSRRRGDKHWIFHGVMTLLFSLVYAGLYFIIKASKDENKQPANT